MIKHYSIVVFGRVQGVSFREWAKTTADKMEIKGFVENRPDGSVYLEAEGEDESLQKFLKKCKRGPILAQVTRLKVKEEKIKGYVEFVITP